ncbi:hypothetical protein [Sorangium sp. So ce124]|uniref:hypothetical protein n=1 Tax=Sorangium sp. So ce124 TaxID=3133280 RepID=UPI003F60CD2F
MIGGAWGIELDTSTAPMSVMCALEHGGRLWQADDDGHVVWFSPRVSMSVLLIHALCKGRGFVGSWREAVEHRHQRLALH